MENMKSPQTWEVWGDLIMFCCDLVLVNLSFKVTVTGAVIFDLQSLKISYKSTDDC